LVSFSTRTDGWKPSIVRTTALENLGIRECAEAIEQYRLFLQQSEIQQKQTIQKQRDRIMELFCRKAYEVLLQDRDGEIQVQDLAVLVANRKIDPYTAAETIWKMIAEKTMVGEGKRPESATDY